jgi:serine/threonine-protein kinase
MEQAIAGYAKATQRDPSYAMAYVGLATAWIDAFWLLPVTPREALANAMSAAEHALALDEDLAEAHAALAYAKFYTWDWPGAEAGFKRSLELNPNSAWALSGYNWGYLTQIRGRYEEALAGERRAVELDPLNSSILNDLGFVLYHAGRYDAAIEQFQQSAEMVPDNIYGYMGLGTTYLALRRFDDAVRWFEKAVEVGGSDSMAKAHLGWAYGRAGRTEESRAILDELTSRYPQEKFTPSNFVFVYQGLGDLDNAFLWLERCFEDQDFYLIFLQGREFEDLWGDPRYAAMKAKIGFPPRG